MENNYGGQWSSISLASMEFTFFGHKAWVVGTIDPRHGLMNVYIDDEFFIAVDT